MRLKEAFRRRFASPTLNTEQQNTTKARQSLWRNKQERLSGDDRFINEGICAMLSPSQTKVASWFSSGHFPSHIELQTKQNLNCLMKGSETGFTFLVKTRTNALFHWYEAWRHFAEPATHRGKQFQQAHLITPMSSLHSKYTHCKSWMRGPPRSKTSAKNSKSLPTQSSRASTGDGTGSFHITRPGKRAHLQALSALMEACKLAATRVTPQVVIGLGGISRVNKSRHSCVGARVHFHLAARACLQSFPQHSPWTHLPLISTPAERAGSPPGLSRPSPGECMSRQTLYWLWGLFVPDSTIHVRHINVLRFTTWWLSPSLVLIFAICALSVIRWRKNCWTSPAFLLNIGPKFECFPKCIFFRECATMLLTVIP